MAENTSISWTHHSFNGWHGCQKISPACDNCYAAAQSHRYGHRVWGKDAPRRMLSDKNWNTPIKWNRDAMAAGERRRVFAFSMADVFEKRPDLVGPRERFWDLVLKTPHLDWLILTKRPQNVKKMWVSMPAQGRPKPSPTRGTPCRASPWNIRKRSCGPCRHRRNRG